MKTLLVAVYGSLRKKHHNHNYYLNNNQTEYLGTDKTEPKFTMYSLGSYPALTLSGTTSIVIEVYRITEDIEKDLDRLEGYPNYYSKTVIDTKWGKAKMYVIPKLSGYPIVNSGDWAKQEV